MSVRGRRPACEPLQVRRPWPTRAGARSPSDAGVGQRLPGAPRPPAPPGVPGHEPWHGVRPDDHHRAQHAHPRRIRGQGTVNGALCYGWQWWGLGCSPQYILCIVLFHKPALQDDSSLSVPAQKIRWKS